MKNKFFLQTGLMAAATALTVAAQTQEGALIPPDAKPGECYAKVVLPPQFETVEERVLIKEGSEDIEVIPPKFETVEEEVVIVPESKKLVPVPPKYEKIIEEIEVRPAMKVWRTSLNLKKAKPVSKALLDALSAQGIDLKTVEPGQCLAEYYIPPKYKTVIEEVIVEPERNETKVIPPQYELVEKEVVIVPEHNVSVEIPAEYEMVEEKVLVEEEKTVWKKGKNPAQHVEGATGDIMCLVKIPPKYKTIKKKVLKAPARTEIKTIPAKTKTIKVKQKIADAKIETVTVAPKVKKIEKKVLDAPAKFIWVRTDEKIEKEWKPTGNVVCLVELPAKTKKIEKMVLKEPAKVEEEIIPAKTKTVKVQKVVEPAKIVKTAIEPEYKVITKRKKIADAKVGWKRILCQTNMTKEIIAKLQSALNEKGYNAGEPDGLMGRATRNALDRFQRDNGLATGGITYETLNALGVTL